MRTKNFKKKGMMMSQLLKYILWGVFLAMGILGVYFLTKGLKLI